jgi:hypothetical protein|tara:strand:- start:3603 stop:3761 length:159 start_codon:yes stop_codon:yes gene_type:complete
MNKTYIGYLIEMLNKDDYFKESENIEIAKGKYFLPSNWEGGKKMIRRQWLNK